MSQCSLLSWASDGKGSCVSWLLQGPKVGLVAVQVVPEKEKGNSVQNDSRVGRRTVGSRACEERNQSPPAAAGSLSGMPGTLRWRNGSAGT